MSKTITVTITIPPTSMNKSETFLPASTEPKTEIENMSKEETITARKEIAKKIDELQIELHDGKIDLHDFYDLIVLLKEDLIDGII